MASFDEVKADFWDDSTYGVQASLTDDATREAERVLGVVLPTALLELLGAQNGGGVRPRWRCHPVGQATSWAADHVPFEALLGIGRAPSALSLLDTPDLVQEWGLPSPVVLLTGDGHWWIGLDYRSCGPYGEPSVTWFDADDDTELPLAPSFRHFLEGLCAPSAG